MEQRVSLVTLGVSDVARARAFYEALGWRGQEVEETVFFQAGGQALVLWSREKLARDCGLPDAGPGGFGGIALAYNVRSDTEVDEVLAALEALELPDVPAHQQPFLEVRVLLDGPEPGLRARIEAAIGDKPVRLAKIEPTRRHAALEAAGEALSLDQLAQLQPDDIFRRLWAQRYGDEAPPEQLAAFAELATALGGDAA